MIKQNPKFIFKNTYSDPVIFWVGADVLEIFCDGFTVFLPGSL